MVLLVSNLAATKLFYLFNFAVDGGIVLFPISYVIGDVAVELYGKKEADRVLLRSFSMSILAAIVFLIVEKLPPHPEWQNQEAFEAILGFAPRIILGSLTAYLASGFTNNVIFVKIKEITGGKGLWFRALTSSVVARAVDSAIFETIAFYGVLSTKEFIKQAIFAYLAGMALESMLTPMTYLATNIFKKIKD